VTYTNALQVFFQRLNYKHSIKGNSFLSMNHNELEEILLGEVQEWKDCDKETQHEVEELSDIMVSCLIKVEKLLSWCKSTKEKE